MTTLKLSELLTKGNLTTAGGTILSTKQVQLLSILEKVFPIINDPKDWQHPLHSWITEASKAGLLTEKEYYELGRLYVIR